jgi:hypothetical protein
MLTLCAALALAALPAALGQPTPVTVTVSATPNPIGSATSPKFIGVNHGACLRAAANAHGSGTAVALIWHTRAQDITTTWTARGWLSCSTWA